MEVQWSISSVGRVVLATRVRSLWRYIANEVGRADEKTAAEYNLEGGNTLHLVLALRGGSS